MVKCTSVQYVAKNYKNQIPCQAVSNKLQLYEFPDTMKDIGKLERQNDNYAKRTNY